MKLFRWLLPLLIWPATAHGQTSTKGTYFINQVAIPVACPANTSCMWTDTTNKQIQFYDGTNTYQVTLAGAYAMGVSAANQTMIINAGDGGSVIVKAGGAATGTLLQVLTSTVAQLFSVADNAQAYLAGSAADSGANKGVVLDTKIALTSGRAYSSIENGGTQQWAYYTTAGGARAIEAKAGTEARVYGNTALTVASSSSEAAYIRVNEASDNTLLAANNNLINAASTNKLKSLTVDGATAVSAEVDTNLSWVNAAAKIQRWLTGGSEKLALYASGRLIWSSNAYVSGSAANSGTNTGVVLDTQTALLSGRHYAEVSNGGTAQWCYWEATGVNSSTPTLQACAGSASQIYGNGDLLVGASSAANSYAQFLAGGNAGIVSTNGNIVLSANSAGAVSVTSSPLSAYHYVAGGSSAPACVTGTGAGGAGASCSLLTGSRDAAGTVEVVLGAVPLASNVIATVTFVTAYASAPRCVLWPSDATAVALSTPYVSSSPTTLILNAGAVALTSGTIDYNYVCFQ